MAEPPKRSGMVGMVRRPGWRSLGSAGSRAHLSIASSSGGPGRMGGASLRWRISVVGRLCGQSPLRGACRSEGLVRGEHPPDGLGELAGDVDAGHLRAALLAQAGLGALVAGGVDGV